MSDDTEDTIVVVNENPDDGNEYTPNTHGYVIVNYIITTGKYTGLNVMDVVKGVNVMPLGVEYGGTLEDPIPYATGMEVFNGKYYIGNDILYLCNRDSGTALYNNLADLVGHYVSVV